MKSTRPLILALALIASLDTAPARATPSSDNCTATVTSLPAVIDTPGVWCLATDLTSADANIDALKIDSNDVTLDCKDHRLIGTAGIDSWALGVHSYDKTGLRVKNCRISGFRYGIVLEGSNNGPGHVVEDNRVQDVGETGIRVDGHRSIIRRNHVAHVGGFPASGAYYGIVTSYSADITDNVIDGVREGAAPANVTGIATYSNLQGSVSRNHIRGLVNTSSGPWPAIAIGIFNDEPGRLTVRDNDVVGTQVTNSYAMRCTMSDSPKARASGNLLVGFPTAIQGCIDAGENDVSP